jgi:succinate-acetate transporter protein
MPSGGAFVKLTILVVGWQGSGGSGVATGTAGIFFGGMLLMIAGIGEFLLGNTFPMIVFFGYGAHFFTYATTFVPAFNVIGFFNPDGSGIGSPGPSNQTSEFLASYGK